MLMPSARLSLLTAVAAVSAIAISQPARAHPHIWITAETTVVYDRGAVTALRQRWLFDEIYSSMAIQGLDANGDGVYDPSELAELAKVNIEGLKEFDYFTFARLGNQSLEFDPPTEFLMEHTETAQPPGQSNGIASADAAPEEAQGSFWTRLTRSLAGSAAPEKRKVLALEFVLPLKQPVLAEAEGFSFSTNDPSFFIWFDLAKEKPIRLADGAPPGCKIDIAAPSQDVAQIQQLGEAAFMQNSGVNISFSSARSVKVICPR